mgnify:CR=1 FL=1
MAAPARRWLWISVAVAAILVVVLYRHFGVGDLLTLERLKDSRDALTALYASRPSAMLLAYFAIYVLATAVSIPGAAVLTLAGGAIFGFWTGLLVVSLASSLGALLAFLAGPLTGEAADLAATAARYPDVPGGAVAPTAAGVPSSGSR